MSSISACFSELAERIISSPYDVGKGCPATKSGCHICLLPFLSQQRSEAPFRSTSLILTPGVKRSAPVATASIGGGVNKVAGYICSVSHFRTSGILAPPPTNTTP